MRNALSAGLLLCALACNTDQPAGITSVADTPKEGVLHAPAVGAKPGDQAIVTVSGAKSVRPGGRVVRAARRRRQGLDPGAFHDRQDG